MPESSRRRFFFAFFIVLIFAAAPLTTAQVVDELWVDEIETYLFQVDYDTTAEIVVYIVQSLRGHGIKDSDGNEINEIVQLGVHIFNEVPLPTPNGDVVGIGKKDLHNGVLVLIAMEEREWRIEVGYGLGGDITDIEAKMIAETYLVPRFQEGNYGEGLYDTVVALSEEIPIPNPVPGLPLRSRYFYENLNPPAGIELPLWLIAVIAVVVGAVIVVVVIVLVYLVRTGRIRPERWRSTGRGGGGWGGGRSPSGGGGRGGGGRSGGGGAGGKW
ncbi:MAG TPA: TPM domain-containing protein [Candidatus Bathyarchaeia archaeon]|nr:TPM domain-containing protein [Candidatus Bathyarchaeia archaeon]